MLYIYDSDVLVFLTRLMPLSQRQIGAHMLSVEQGHRGMRADRRKARGLLSRGLASVRHCEHSQPSVQPESRDVSMSGQISSKPQIASAKIRWQVAS
jgi:hypothetical protein